ncbi:MAG: RNA polymerase factor sigma-54, partial [Alphaproteobacteria bacterium]
IKLLQLTSLDLMAYVDQELERNPLLGSAEAEGERGEAAEPPPTPEAPARDSADALADDGGIAERAADADANFENVWESEGDGAGSWSVTSGKGGGFDDTGFGWEDTLTESVSLRDHLWRQFSLERHSPAERLIVNRLIDAIDGDGYLRADLDEIASEVGAHPDEVEAAIQRIQGFDPVGVGARSLAECFALQLKARDRFDPAMRALVENLNLLAARDFVALRKLCGVDGEDLGDMIEELRLLDAKPGSSFEAPPVEVVAPDVIMRRAPDGDWAIELNPETMPRVLVDSGYCESLRAKARRRDDREFLTENLASANWLVKALQQRANTILKTATEIVRRQDAFFRLGVVGLKPMTLKDVADAIEMHESTISRVVNGKYISTPRGVVELKSFFTAAIGGRGDGDALSAEAVRFRIKALIDHEAPNSVLSDDRIVDILAGEGVDIARRTVAKYREAMHIPSSVQRRRQKLALAS